MLNVEAADDIRLAVALDIGPSRRRLFRSCLHDWTGVRITHTLLIRERAVPEPDPEWPFCVITRARAASASRGYACGLGDISRDGSHNAAYLHSAHLHAIISPRPLPGAPTPPPTGRHLAVKVPGPKNNLEKLGWRFYMSYRFWGSKGSCPLFLPGVLITSTFCSVFSS